ncbi:MAG: selenide, water dikinase SelD [Anaerolineae bacterium]|nr:selenide, water dikinase SelD [Anaerolineae bacterium]
MAEIFPQEEYPALLVGLSTADDAAVWEISKERALIFTVDFFTPIVDDPYDYGAIAAANALSDVYAMGGEPFLALNVAAFPAALPEEMIVEILRGGAEKVKEAGAVIAGGHTIDDDEPKFGLAVLGFVSPQQLRTKAGAQPGDLVLLTKPLGTGIITTAFKAHEAKPEHLATAVDWMKKLNRDALLALRKAPCHAVTDVTGFGLLGHAWEVAEKSGVALTLRFEALPFHPGALQYAEDLLFPAMAGKNLADYAPHVSFSSKLEYEEQLLVACPETSGGLLFTLPPKYAEAFLARYAEMGHRAWVIGEVSAGEPTVSVV